ncbi:hypothetical protein TELCIR_02242 [Teladorsagia circumcincta]|uniref:SXP/RAL-2 family protein Ani s 5-like cation-binding domain-containing protein n=1 Tax=Teladorsagia circumcincta TaxID=45464 RepID=A0A2G9UZR0_TELCI|nr:hypothetical protein TELCIR_02242 [Teladorsagia circumcincta]
MRTLIVVLFLTCIPAVAAQFGMGMGFPPPPPPPFGGFGGFGPMGGFGGPMGGFGFGGPFGFGGNTVEKEINSLADEFLQRSEHRDRVRRFQNFIFEREPGLDVWDNNILFVSLFNLFSVDINKSENNTHHNQILKSSMRER